MNKLRVFEAFSGIGAQRMELRNLNINFEIVATSEIDKYAIKSYGNIHEDMNKKLEETTKGLSDEEMYQFLESRDTPLDPKTFECIARKLKGKELKQVYTSCLLSNNLGNIAKINTDEIPDHDLFTYSFPCQDISVAGRQRGLDKDSSTRSSLLWECEKIISTKKPKYLLMENVKNLISKQHKHNFDKWLKWLESQGYTNYWKVINCKNYGLPQTRERVFVVSILDEAQFQFDQPIKLDKCLGDFLEDTVDEKYYLSDKIQQRFQQTKPDDGTNNIIGTTAPDFRTIGQRDLVYSQKGLIGALVATDYKQPKQIFEFEKEIPLNVSMTDMLEDEVDEKYYLSDKMMNYAFDLDGKMKGTKWEKRLDKETINKKIASTIACRTAGGNQRVGVSNFVSDDKTSELSVLDIKKQLNSNKKFRIRKLTPLECWRVMGMSDADLYKAKEVCSDTQLYKQAGNSIPLNSLAPIFRPLFTGGYSKC